MSNAGSRADEASGGGPKKGKVGAVGHMGRSLRAQNSCIANIVKELNITTPSVLKMLSDQKAKQLQKEQDALASPSSLLTRGGLGSTDFSELDMDTYLSQKLTKKDSKDTDFNWGGMFDSLTQFENDLVYWVSLVESYHSAYVDSYFSNIIFLSLFIRCLYLIYLERVSTAQSLLKSTSSMPSLPPKP